MRQIALIRTILIVGILLVGDAWAVSKGPSRARQKCTLAERTPSAIKGSVLLDAQNRFRRIQAYSQLPQLFNAMATLLDRQEAAA